MPAVPWSSAAGGVVLAVRLTPKGGRDSIEGIETSADGRAVLKARVRAAPSEGEANAALIQVLAKAVGVPPRNIALISGATTRLKRLMISGDSPTLVAALERLSKTK
jgi:uncharacterized protein (TIGR00251 family)